MRAPLFTLFLLAAAPALAQSTSIAASITGDITRFTSVNTEPLPASFYGGAPLDGEALGFTIGAARALGERWGVAIEFGRTGEIESTRRREIDPRILGITLPIPLPPGVGGVPGIGPIFDFSFENRSELQLMTISALAWVKHAAGERVELSYTGGLTLLRSEAETEISITDTRLAIWAVPAGLETVEHRAAPVVGVDAAIRFTEHTAFSAGIRVHAITVTGTSGWLMRPFAGVRWTF